MPEHLVVVGGVAGGMTAAVWARRQSPNMRITVVERGEDVSYSECGIPYVFSGEVESLDKLIRYRPDELRAKHDIETLTGWNAEELNASAQSIEIRNLRSGERKKIYFDYLVIATGARPTTPNIEGVNLNGVFTLRHMHEARSIQSYLKSASPQKAVVVGAGFLGLEMAEALRRRGLSVTMLEKSSSILRSFTGDLKTRLESELNAKGVELRYNDEIRLVEGRDRVERVVASSGAVDADILIFGTGVTPNVAMAKAAGIRLGATGAIAVKNTQQTNYPSIYAAGDCCEAFHLVSERPAFIPLGTTANKQGRVAGINSAGGRAEFKGVVGTMVVKVFDMEAASAGLNAEEAAAAGFSPKIIQSRSISRAGYYPGAQPIDLEIVYDERTGRLLGTRMAGREGVAKRIDVAATALYARMKIEDLLQLDLGYAPPFAPVWDPILYAVRKAE